MNAYDYFKLLEDVLTPRQLMILLMRFGFLPLKGHKFGEPVTLEEVGRRFGITRERVRQLEARSLHRTEFPEKISESQREYIEEIKAKEKE
jgi:RNA polymerase primary sigma factor